MRLILYNLSSELNRVDKNNYLKHIITMEGVLRETSSILTPSILIELNPELLSQQLIKKTYVVDDDNQYVTKDGTLRLIYTLINKILTSNYAYIPDFNRYYFINDIISVRQNMWRVVMNVDVLMSYKTQIYNLDAFVNRNEFEYDEMVKDDMVSYYYDKEVSEYIPSKGNKVNTTFNTNISHNRNCVLSCISFQSMPAGHNIEPPSGTTLPTIRQYEYEEMFSETCFIMPMYKINVVAYRTLKSDNLSTYVKSIVVYPFDLEAKSNTQVIVYLGDTAIETLESTEETPVYLYADYAKYKVSDYYVIADFTINGDKFFDYEPYTMYELFIPYYGWITLSANQILNHRLIVYYTIKVEDGSANVYVYDVTDNKTLFTSTCQLGIRIGLSTTNNEEISASKKANNLNLTLGLVSSIASIGIGAYTGNATAVVGGVLSGAKSIATFVNNNSMMFDRAQSTFGDSVSGMYSSQDVVIRKTIMKPKNYDENYAKLFGKPLNQYKKLSNLKGYTILGEVHIEEIDSITSTEFDVLYNILTTGFIL